MRCGKASPARVLSPPPARVPRGSETLARVLPAAAAAAAAFDPDAGTLSRGPAMDTGRKRTAPEAGANGAGGPKRARGEQLL